MILVLNIVQQQVTRSLDLSRVRWDFQKKSDRQKDGQTDRETNKQTNINVLNELTIVGNTFSTLKMPLKQLCDKRTDGRTDRGTDRTVVYRVA